MPAPTTADVESIAGRHGALVTRGRPVSKLAAAAAAQSEVMRPVNARGGSGNGLTHGAGRGQPAAAASSRATFAPGRLGAHRLGSAFSSAVFSRAGSTRQ